MEERHELIELAKTLDNMIDNMKKMSQMWEVSEEARHFLEEQYPFTDSFDEILRVVVEWRGSVIQKIIELTQVDPRLTVRERYEVVLEIENGILPSERKVADFPSLEEAEREAERISKKMVKFEGRSSVYVQTYWYIALRGDEDEYLWAERFYDYTEALNAFLLLKKKKETLKRWSEYLRF